MSVADDLKQIAVQEKGLALPAFDHATAWNIGSRLRDLAVARRQSVVADVRRFGLPLFYCALPGTTPDHADWIRRKSNTVARFLRSTYAVGLELTDKKSTLTEKYALPASEYVSHGGGFPLSVAGVGVIGSVTISGLVQRADHELVIEALCGELGLDYAEWKLADPA